MRRSLVLGLVLLAVSLILAACGGASGGSTGARADDSSELVAHFASFDVAVGDNPRVIVGLLTADAQVVSFGTAIFAFTYLGERDASGPPTAGPTAEASWLPLPGQEVADPPPRARVVGPGDRTGVYAAHGVRFDAPGYWEVAVRIMVDGKDETATAMFTVAADHAVLAVGEAAPRTANPLPGTSGVPPAAIDSRAGADGVVPDPELHATTIADAIAAGRPTMVVVSTPVYCVSRFCGPITDAVQQLAREHPSDASFVHLEVWEDYEANRLNPAISGWVVPDNGSDGSEPWVFLVGRDGIVTHRWDNVASEAEMRAALDEVLAQ